MKIAIAKFGQETSSFSPTPTTLETFKQYGLYEGEEILTKSRGVGPIGGFLEVAAEQEVDWIPVPLIRGWAGASGVITAETLKFFEDKLLTGLCTAGAVDAFYFDLHGAGQAENVPDSEGHLLERIRTHLGNEIPIVISLDHHANLTQQMLNCVNALVADRTQPHQPFETGQLAAKMLFAMMRGELKPTIAWRKIPMIAHQEQFLTTVAGPMREWFDLARHMETQPGVEAASTFPMQPWLDVPEGGWATAVVTNNDPDLANQLVAELAEAVWERRERLWKLDSISPIDAVRRAVEADRGLVVLSDTGDSVFGGATGDSTVLLREMLNQQVKQPALVPMVDPKVVQQAIAAGVGNELSTDIGGKQDTRFSRPVKITARVGALSGGRIRANVGGLESFDMGRTALLEVGSIRIVASEARGIGGNHPIVYRHFGIEPANAKMVVLKTASNWQYYTDMTSEVIRANTPGMTMSNLHEFDWVNLPRPIYPLDDLADWSP